MDRRGPVVADSLPAGGGDESYWTATSPSTSYPALTSDVTVDVADRLALIDASRVDQPGRLLFRMVTPWSRSSFNTVPFANL